MTECVCGQSTEANSLCGQSVVTARTGHADAQQLCLVCDRTEVLHAMDAVKTFKGHGSTTRTTRAHSTIQHPHMHSTDNVLYTVPVHVGGCTAVHSHAWGENEAREFVTWVGDVARFDGPLIGHVQSRAGSDVGGGGGAGKPRSL
jgi:hypothetical protein